MQNNAYQPLDLQAANRLLAAMQVPQQQQGQQSMYIPAQQAAPPGYVLNPQYVPAQQQYVPVQQPLPNNLPYGVAAPPVYDARANELAKRQQIAQARIAQGLPVPPEYAPPGYVPWNTDAHLPAQQVIHGSQNPHVTQQQYVTQGYQAAAQQQYIPAQQAAPPGYVLNPQYVPVQQQYVPQQNVEIVDHGYGRDGYKSPTAQFNAENQRVHMQKAQAVQAEPVQPVHNVAVEIPACTYEPAPVVTLQQRAPWHPPRCEKLSGTATFAPGPYPGVAREMRNDGLPFTVACLAPAGVPHLYMCGEAGQQAYKYPKPMDGDSCLTLNHDLHMILTSINEDGNPVFYPDADLAKSMVSGILRLNDDIREFVLGIVRKLCRVDDVYRFYQLTADLARIMIAVHNGSGAVNKPPMDKRQALETALICLASDYAFAMNVPLDTTQHAPGEQTDVEYALVAMHYLWSLIGGFIHCDRFPHGWDRNQALSRLDAAQCAIFGVGTNHPGMATYSPYAYDHLLPEISSWELPKEAREVSATNYMDWYRKSYIAYVNGSTPVQTTVAPKPVLTPTVNYTHAAAATVEPEYMDVEEWVLGPGINEHGVFSNSVRKKVTRRVAVAVDQPITQPQPVYEPPRQVEVKVEARTQQPPAKQPTKDLIIEEIKSRTPELRKSSPKVDDCDIVDVRQVPVYEGVKDKTVLTALLDELNALTMSFDIAMLNAGLPQDHIDHIRGYVITGQYVPSKHSNLSNKARDRMASLIRAQIVEGLQEYPLAMTIDEAVVLIRDIFIWFTAAGLPMKPADMYQCTKDVYPEWDPSTPTILRKREFNPKEVKPELDLERLEDVLVEQLSEVKEEEYPAPTQELLMSILKPSLLKESPYDPRADEAVLDGTYAEYLAQKQVEEEQGDDSMDEDEDSYFHLGDPDVSPLEDVQPEDDDNIDVEPADFDAEPLQILKGKIRVVPYVSVGKQRYKLYDSVTGLEVSDTDERPDYLI